MCDKNNWSGAAVSEVHLDDPDATNWADWDLGVAAAETDSCRLNTASTPHGKWKYNCLFCNVNDNSSGIE